MNILITGGAGFIGSHLAQALLQQGHHVTAVDNLSTGRLENLAQIQDHPHFRFVLDNVRNTEVMHLLIDQADQVYHLAAAVGVQLIVDQPVRTIETNIHGTEVVLEIANKFRKKILLASTSEVYGKSRADSFNEDDDLLLGSTRFSRWSYACSKAIDEFLGLAYHQQFGLPVVVVRLFNTVGPRQTGQYGMVIPRFVERALKGESLQVYGTGSQSRCFCYVGDVIQALIGLMATPAAAGRVFNVGSTEEITIENLARRIIDLTGSTSPIERLSYEQAYGRPFDDMLRRLPDLTRIRQAIGWRPTTRLDEILRLIIAERQSRQL